MKVYMVGGAVRDSILNRPFLERDWVVVGATEKQMLDLGYKKCGKDFPVFLHPITKEEYALARKERKVSHGHKGFVCFSDENVTLEEDLYRRDITINAIAKEVETNKIIDPFKGVQDIENRIIRHISKAFSEDPLRVLRVARFFAVLSPWNFKVDKDTLTLLKQISNQKELETLSAERVWQETKKALLSPSPNKYLEILKECDAIRIVFPEIEGELFEKAIKELKEASKEDSLEVRIWAMFSCLPTYCITNICQRLKIPNYIKNCMKSLSKHPIHDYIPWTANSLINFISNIDGWRNFLNVEVITRWLSIKNNKEAMILKKAYEESSKIKASSLDVPEKEQGPKVGSYIKEARIKKASKILDDN